MRVMAQVNNNIFFIMSLGTGKVSRFRTVAAVTDRSYIQNNSTVSFGLFAGVTLPAVLGLRYGVLPYAQEP
jgi:hypothetical protein